MAEEHKEEHGDGHAEGERHAKHGGHGPGGHGGEHEEGGCPEWMISFADNTALMMGLFVILLAMNMGPKATAVMGGEPSEVETSASPQTESMLDFAISVREAFNNPVDMGSSEPRDEALRERIRRQIRSNTTPRHVPAVILQVPEIPRTISGKVVELAVREAIHGRPVRNTDALANPGALEYFRNRAELQG